MSKLINVAKTSAIPEGQAAAFEVEGKKIAIFNVDGTFHALDDTCPHAGAPLSSGYVQDGRVGCPWHGADFDLRTGAVLCPPARGGVQVYPVKIDGEDLFLEI